MARKKIEVVTGERFHRLVVLREVYPIGSDTAVLARCDCGKEITVRYFSIRSGNTKSCGCLRAERTRERNKASTGKKKSQYTKRDTEWWGHWERQGEGLKGVNE